MGTAALLGGAVRKRRAAAAAADWRVSALLMLPSPLLLVADKVVEEEGRDGAAVGRRKAVAGCGGHARATTRRSRASGLRPGRGGCCGLRGFMLVALCAACVPCGGKDGDNGGGEWGVVEKATQTARHGQEMDESEGLGQCVRRVGEDGAAALQRAASRALPLF